MSRTNWDTFHMDLAAQMAEMTTCQSGRSVGAVIVRDKRVLAMGVNGVPSGYPHPESCARRDLGVPSGERLDLCPCIHAEANALVNAARQGVSIVGATLYCTTMPCQQCMGMVTNAGLSRVVYRDGYASELTRDIAGQGGVALEQHCGGSGP